VERQPIGSCIFAAVSRRAATAALVFGLVAATAGLVRPTFAALQVVVSVSPAQVEVGGTVEVLVRTFVPFAQGDLGLPMPSQSYPVPSGYWNVLYPAEYPFDVAAEAEGGASLRVQLARDSHDATLWRGTFTPTKPGIWTVRVRNFGAGEPGASGSVRVLPGPAVPTGLVIASLALILGFLLGIAFGPRSRR